MGHPEEVDIIVCGGGPAGTVTYVVVLAVVVLAECFCAGCVVAGRLAYADPNLKVMLIEGQKYHIFSHIRSSLMAFCFRWRQ